MSLRQFIASRKFLRHVESLTNIARHAQARTVHIRVLVDPPPDPVLYIEVRDDGKGLPADPSEEQSSFGLPTLREQLSHFGGEMEIHSEPSVGTRILLKVPLSELNPEL